MAVDIDGGERMTSNEAEKVELIWGKTWNTILGLKYKTGNIRNGLGKV